MTTSIGLGLWVALAAGQTAVAAECVPDGEPERVSVSHGMRVTVASGLTVTVVGDSWDHYDDGSFDHQLEVRLDRGEAHETRVVSPQYQATLGHCWRLAEDAGAQVRLEVAMQLDETKAVPSCTQPSELPVFDSFFDVAPGVRFQAQLRYDAAIHEWRVTPTPTFLPHHATRLVWSNLASSELGRARDATVRVELEVGASDVRKVPDRHQWQATHSATIQSVCRVE